jgi:release factor glutamine methyltransferase
MTSEALERGRMLYERNRTDPDRPAEFTLLGRRWHLLPEVFSPTYTPSTELFSSWVPYPRGGTFLEVGSGAGVTSVQAALAGCVAVTGVDISAEAVENTRRNAELHGVADRVRVLRCDLFDGLGADERFDAVYWNSSFLRTADDFTAETDLQLAFFDPGYRAHDRYVREAPGRLTEGGRLLLGFSDLGDWAWLRAAAARVGRAVEVLRAERGRGTSVEFQLVELVPAD